MCPPHPLQNLRFRHDCLLVQWNAWSETKAGGRQRLCREMTGEKIIKTRKMRGNKRSLFHTHTSKTCAEALWQQSGAAGFLCFFLFNSSVFGGLENLSRQLPGEKCKWLINIGNKCSTSLVIKEMQIQDNKITFSPIKLTEIKRNSNSQQGRCGGRSLAAAELIRTTFLLGNFALCSKSLKNIATSWPGTSPSRFSPKDISSNWSKYIIGMLFTTRKKHKNKLLLCY